MDSITRRSRAVMATAGGHRSARRLVVLVLVLVLVILTGLPVGAAAPDANDDQPDIMVREEQGVYTISARFTVPSSPAIVVSVLTDYDDIPRFLPNVRTSRLLERTDNRVLVEQEAIVKMLFFSTRIHLLLGIEEAPLAIRFVDRSGKSFVRYEGAWTLVEADEDRVAITYELTAKPSFDAPGFLIRRLMQRDASDQIRRLRAEMAARSGGTPQ